MLPRNPGFVAVAIASLALGIGANATVFSLLNAVALRHLDAPRPEQLVSLSIPRVFVNDAHASRIRALGSRSCPPCSL